MIEIPDRSVHDYLRSFGLGCVFVTAKGAIGAGADLADAECPAVAWWVRSRRHCGLGEDAKARVPRAPAVAA